MTAERRVTALVVTFHTGPRLKECLYTLRADPEVDEVIVIDNGNPDKDQLWLDALADASESVRVVRDGTNPGFGAAVNRAARLTDSDDLLVINPDAVMKRGSVAILRAVLADAGTPAIVGGKIFNVQGVEERGGRRKTLTLWRALGFEKWTLETEPEPGGPVRVGSVSGAFFMMRSADFQALGGFDESYFIHVEDLDLCRRVNEAGGEVIYVPGAGALHYTSTSDVTSDFVRAHKIRSLKHYFRKFSGGWMGRVGTEIVLLGLGVAMRLRG